MFWKAAREMLLNWAAPSKASSCQWDWHVCCCKCTVKQVWITRMPVLLVEWPLPAYVSTGVGTLPTCQSKSKTRQRGWQNGHRERVFWVEEDGSGERDGRGAPIHILGLKTQFCTRDWTGMAPSCSIEARGIQHTKRSAAWLPVCIVLRVAWLGLGCQNFSPNVKMCTLYSTIKGGL